MNRCLAITMIVLWCWIGVAAAEQDRRPNILFLLTDDQGWWDLGMRGNEDIDTPVLDQLAADSADFTRFYAAPVCAPTRAGLMTGRYCFRTGLYNTRFGGDTLGRDEITIAEMLQQAGYQTGCFGKWHLGKYAPYQPHHRGFDQFLGHYAGHIDEYDYPDQLVLNGEPVEARRYVTDLFTDAAIDFIGANRDRSWFCYVPYNAPHSPWVVGTSHDRQERGDQLIAKYLKRGLELREARIYAMIELVDQNVGRLLDQLDEWQLTDDTVVVFMTDNGGVSKHYKAGLRGNKASVYEGGVRVPLLVRWPGRIPAGCEIQSLASHVDLFPTFCELAGVQPPDDRVIDGKSLLPLLMSGESLDHHDYVYHTWDRYYPNPDRRWAIADRRWKLLCQVGNSIKDPQDHWRLFDLQNDPGEENNVIREHPEKARQLRTEFVRWFDDVTDGVTYQPVAIPVGDPREPLVEIQASWATWQGDNVQYVFRGYDWDTIEGWKDQGESATWSLDVAEAGSFDVDICYGRSSSSQGVVTIEVGQNRINFDPPATATPDVFRCLHAGRLKLPAGKMTLRAVISEGDTQEVIRLNRIRLKQVNEKAK